jgi:hypothetical protein
LANPAGSLCGESCGFALRRRELALLGQFPDLIDLRRYFGLDRMPRLRRRRLVPRRFLVIA